MQNKTINTKNTSKSKRRGKGGFADESEELTSNHIFHFVIVGN